MPELGRAALVVCFLLALYAVVAGFWGAHTRRRRLSQSAQNALIAAFGSALVASAVLLVALGRSDFRFSYVSAHTSRELPTAYKLASFYGGQEGSLLLWLVVLTGYGAAAVLLDRKAGRELVAWVVPVLGVVATFFALLVTFVASPFHTQLASADGAGLNPSLQSPYFQIHPPLLYLGYVGLTVPFAFATGALLSGRTDERWIVATRRWTLAAWMFLGIGQLLGAKWAYEEVGWGGYFAWDPVENAALMPWLAATAFLHSVMVQEKKGMLKVWNMLLVQLAFALSLFGTFLTRSGVLSSIHSFTESSIGPWFLGFICFVVASSLVLLFWRLPLLRAKTKLESLVSREATFLYNNLLLVALCLTILWGVLFPILTEAVRGEAVTVGGRTTTSSSGPSGCRCSAHGHRPADRLAAGLALLAEARVHLADRVRAGRGGDADRIGCRLVEARADRLHVRGVRGGDDRARVLARNRRAPRALWRVRSPRVRGADRAQPAPLRWLHRPRRDRPARDRDRRLERVRRLSQRPSRAGPIREAAGLHARLPWLDLEAGGERDRDACDDRRLPRWRPHRRDAPRQEQLPGRAAGLERGRDPLGLADGRGSLPDHRAGERERHDRLQRRS
jgi:hypothetical protein